MSRQRRPYNAAFQAARRVAIKRDGNSCQKCGDTKGLQAHHIQPRDKGGSDEPENLLILCGDCHREWEMLAYGSVSLADWLTLMPLPYLLMIILTPELWQDDIPASALRQLLATDSETMSDGLQVIMERMKQEEETDGNAASIIPALGD